GAGDAQRAARRLGDMHVGHRQRVAVGGAEHLAAVLGHGLGAGHGVDRRVVDRVDGDRDGLGGAGQRGGAAAADGATVVWITAVGDVVGEAVGAVVVGGRGVGEGAVRGTGHQAAVAGAAGDGVAQVGVAGLDVGHQAAQVDAGGGVLVGRGVAVVGHRRVVDRVDGDVDGRRVGLGIGHAVGGA